MKTNLLVHCIEPTDASSTPCDYGGWSAGEPEPEAGSVCPSATALPSCDPFRVISAGEG